MRVLCHERGSAQKEQGHDARQDVLQWNSHRGHLLNQWAEFETAGTREVGEACGAWSEPFERLIRPSSICVMESAKLKIRLSCVTTTTARSSETATPRNVRNDSPSTSIVPLLASKR